MKKNLLFSLAILGLSGTLSAQSEKKCASHVLHQEYLQQHPEAVVFREKLEQFTQASQNSNKRITGTVYTIPVVIHVIHNGEAVGTGQNISDAQIMSQIDVLNKDFRWTNSDKLAANHAFYSLAADCEIEFCLAKRDTAGKTTTGIIRYNKGKASWTVNDFDSIVKPSTAWDRTKYMNIWICTLGGADATTLGYATFPGTNNVKDGVVIAHTAFGTSGSVNTGTDLGRTGSHEVGHYLNLFHIWGDAECGDDQVSDTPPQKAANQSNCPTFPHNVNSTCNPGPNGEMYMNYMDYVNDNCMNTFTAGQKARMRAALEGARASLLQSNACSVVTGVEDLASTSANLYPNPANETVNVTADAAIKSVTVYAISGQNVSNLLGASINGNTATLNTQGLAGGNYLVKVETANGVSNKSLAIVK